MTNVKICGITNLNDAMAAAEAGADALGFNFYAKSPRYISAETARSITQELPGSTLKVGVFVDESIETIAMTVDVAGLNVIQLHGDESPGYVDELRRRTSCDLIKAFRVSDDFSPEDALDYSVEGILLDAFSADVHGGTGETFDWDVAKSVWTLIGCLWLAGGLTPENVAEAIAAVRPFAVDACSSLEIGPGIKDPAKMRHFIKEAKRA
jgi:phosphoribosylanthranilate isomerase